MGGMGRQALQPERWEEDQDECRPDAAPPHDGGAGHAVVEKGPIADVLPRLALARRMPPAKAAEGGLPIGPDDVAAFALTILERDADEAMARIHALLDRGATLETIFLNLLGPAARSLGELWNDDVCDFTQVTVGSWRLQQLLRELSPSFTDPGEVPDPARRALLVPAPGEQHTFGLFMVAEFFRRAGWEVRAGPFVSTEEMLDVLRHESFAVVGISASSHARIEGVAATIRSIRKASRNRAVGVLVGGPPFVEQPELAKRLGADASAVDGRHAVLQAESLLALAARRA